MLRAQIIVRRNYFEMRFTTRALTHNVSKYTLFVFNMVLADGEEKGVNQGARQ